MIILDTNVLSELMRPQPNPAVVSWVAKQSTAELFTTTITQAEILYGLALLPAGNRRHQLTKAAEDMFGEDFAGRLLAFDSAAAREFATIAAERRQSGKGISQLDAQIVSIASSRGAQLATRNVDDFSGCGVGVLNPWD